MSNIFKFGKLNYPFKVLNYKRPNEYINFTMKRVFFLNHQFNFSLTLEALKIFINKKKN